MKAPLRTFLSTLAAAILVLTLASGECISCRTSVSASYRKGDCCTPDGRCKASNHKSPPNPCLKAHNSQVALLEQGVQVHTVIAASTLEVTEWVDPVLNQIQARAPLTTNYSPPEPYLLNSSFLI
jgi:hypothetical protein